MKKKFALLLTAFLFVALGISSCKKYEDGPSFTLKTRKSRMANNWVLFKYFVNGQDETSSQQAALGNDFGLELTKAGDYRQTSNGIVSTGTWEFMNNDEDLHFNQTSPVNSDLILHILKLESKELWLKHTGSNSTYEIHYSQK